MTEREQYKVDRFRPNLAIRLIAGKEGRDALSTWRQTKEYKLSKVRAREYEAKKSLNKLERRMKRKFKDIPLEEFVDYDVSWLRS